VPVPKLPPESEPATPGPPAEVPNPPKNNGFWVDETQEIKVTIYAYRNPTTGEIVDFTMDPVDLSPGPDGTDPPFRVEPIESTWTVPGYAATERLRQESMQWSRAANGFVENPAGIRKRLLRHHLRGINVPDVTGKPLILERVNEQNRESLTQDAETKLGNLSPVVLDLLLAKYRTITRLFF
jgi:hypothetical protein